MKYQYNLQDADFTVENIDIQNVSRPKDYRHSFRSGRVKHGFIYVISGQMLDVFQSGKKESICVDTGELIFVPKGSIYTGVYLKENTEIKIIQFDLARGELPPYLSSPAKIGLPNAGELIESFFKPTENRTSSHPFYYLSCLYNLLWQIDESYSRIPTKYKKLQPALSEITEYWNKNETVAYYAELCSMSEVNFRRLFREYTGMSPIDYRNDLRLKNAKTMLGSGEYNVTEAAAASGFSNLSFFIRLYKKKYGYTPKKE
ncbi:MAG: helix-turn-helix transcriptional regulator [Clostridia bacterium]|nr:helix-turn-helix transcriptional regulator [Clostridia bacterium]